MSFEADGLQLDLVDPAITYFEAVRGLVYAVEAGLVPSGGQIVDIGAYAGAVGLLALKRGAAHCLFVEPVNAKLLLSNIEKNRLADACAVLPFAVWDEGGLALTMGQSGYGRVLNPEGGGDGIQVPTISLKSILSLYKRIDYLKVDIEGAEYRVLERTEEMSHLLSTRVGVIDLEFHQRHYSFNERGWFHPSWAPPSEVTPIASKAVGELILAMLRDAGFVRTHPEQSWWDANPACDVTDHVLLVNQRWGPDGP